MCQALGTAGIDTLIVTTNADGPSRLPVPLGITLDYDGVPTLFFPHQWSESFKLSLPLARWLHRHVAEFDVVHVHGVFSHSSLAASAASRRARVPYILRPLGNLDPWGMRQSASQKQVFLRVAGRRMLTGAAAIHYTTTAEKQLAEAAHQLDRGVVIPLGLAETIHAAPSDPERFRQMHPEIGRAPYVLMLGRLHPVKGVEPFVEAFLDVTRNAAFGAWRLVLAGDGAPAYVAALRRQVDALDHDGRVHWVGWLGGDEKLAALDGASLLAQPSHQENFGVSAAEAMARGVPVLISPQVNLASDVAAVQAGWVVPLGRDTLRSGLLEALGQPDERSRRGAAARRLATERFTWSRLATDLASLYQSVTR